MQVYDKLKKDPILIWDFLNTFSLLILFVIGGVMSLIEAQRLQTVTNYPNYLAGPSGYMTILGILLLVLALIEVRSSVKTFRKVREERIEMQQAGAEQSNEEQQKDRDEKLHNRKMWVTYAMLIGFLVLIKPLGFMIASLLFLSANLLYLGNSIKTTSITVAVIFLVLYFGAPSMGLSIPRGIFGI